MKDDKKDDKDNTKKIDKESVSEKTKEKDVDESEAKQDDVEAKEKEKKKEEPDFEMIDNPARVMAPQLKKLSLPSDCRYDPVKTVSLHTLDIFCEFLKHYVVHILEQIRGCNIKDRQ